MEMRKINILFVLFTLLLISSGMHSSRRLITSDSMDDTVEKFLSNCGLDPKLKTTVNNLDIASADKFIIDSTYAFCKKNFCIDSVTWKFRQRFFYCLSKLNILFQESADGTTWNRYSEFQASFATSRRYLEDIPPPTLSSGLAPILAPGSPPSLAPVFQTPPAPMPSTSGDIVAVSPPTTISEPILLQSPQIFEGPEPSNSVVASSKKNNRSKKLVVTAVVLSVLGAAVIVVCLIFCCCRCASKTSVSEDGQKDDRPLLTLSLSDFSGSYYGSRFGNSVQKDKLETSSIKTELGVYGHIVTADNLAVSIDPESNANIATSPLKLPPGRPMASPPTAPAPPPTAPSPPPAAPVPPPPPLPEAKPIPSPPPKGAGPPRPPQASSSYSKVPPRPSPLGPNRLNHVDVDDIAPKTKLKPLFWDKVSTNPEKSMVWNEIKSGSFQFNEEMIETLFGYRNEDKRKADGKKGLSLKDPTQYIQLLDPKKSQNLAISLKALSIKVDEVSDALKEGNELPPELLQSLLRMAPTSDEELKIRLYNGDPSLLGPGEQFLKAIIDIPYAFKRIEALLFISSLPEDISSIKESFASLEIACKELRSSRLFLKLLEAVLKLGNRMNDGTFRGGAQAFKLDTLLKLSDVKGVDGKTTLLHFVVQEIIKSEGARAIRLAKETEEDFSQEVIGLKVISSLSSELDNVKKAALLDADALANSVASFGHKSVKTKEFLNNDMQSIEESGFHRLLKSFVEHAKVDITFLLDEEKRIRALVKSTTDYFQGNSGRDEGLRLFVIVRDFLNMVDKTCKEVRESSKVKVQKNNNLLSNLENRQHLFPASRDRRIDSSNSDEDDPK